MIAIIHSKEIAPIEAYAASIKSIDNPMDLDYASEKLSQAKNLLDSVEAYRKSKTDPLNAALKIIRAETSPLEGRLEALIASLKAAITSYTQEQEKSRLAQEQAIAGRVAPGRGNLSLEKASERIAALPEIPKAEGIAMTSIRKFRILDISLVPKEYILPNEPMIRKAMFANVAIPGIEYYQEKQIRIK